METAFEVLYKKGSKGKIMFRRVTIKNHQQDLTAIQYTETGTFTDAGGHHRPKVQVKVHKPTGSTTAFNRAVKLCESEHTKRLRLGYFTSHEDAMNKEPVPKKMLVKDMLVTDIPKMSMNEFPLYQQVKLNGIAGTYHHDTGTILSRELNVFNLVKMTEECGDICETLKLKYLDFEIYAEGFPINEIVSMVRHDDPRLKAYIFDVPGIGIFTDRLTDCSSVLDYLKSHFNDTIKVLSINVANQWGDVQKFYDDSIAEDHEGIILRDPEGKYCWNNKTTRSNVIRKIKPILSAEFKIVDIEWDDRIVSGKPVHLVEFICEVTPGGDRFKVAPTGWGIEMRDNWKPEYISHERMKMSGVAADILNPLSIDFREYTKTGKPFHVLGCYLREDIEEI